jgi:hypothetical protein
MITLILSDEHASILYDLVNSSSCEWDGVVISDVLAYPPDNVNEMLHEVFRILKESGVK